MVAEENISLLADRLGEWRIYRSRFQRICSDTEVGGSDTEVGFSRGFSIFRRSAVWIGPYDWREQVGVSIDHVTHLILSSLNSKTGGGVTFCPLAKTLFPFSESIQIKFFWKLDKTLVSMEAMVSVLRLFITFRFLTENPYSKLKNLVPLVETKQKKLFLKASKKSNQMTSFLVP